MGLLDVQNLSDEKKILALFEVKKTRWLENSMFASAENIL
jgi:hypothetical protein